MAVKGGEYTLYASDGAGGTEGGWQDGYVVTDADEYLAALQDSDIQIYWPYSERWDGTQLPVITYDPGYDTDVNIGYEVSINDDGSRSIREMEVNEELAKERKKWEEKKKLKLVLDGDETNPKLKYISHGFQHTLLF